MTAAGATCALAQGVTAAGIGSDVWLGSVVWESLSFGVVFTIALFLVLFLLWICILTFGPCVKNLIQKITSSCKITCRCDGRNNNKTY